MNRYVICAVDLSLLHIMHIRLGNGDTPKTFGYCCRIIIDHIFVFIDCETVCKLRFFPRNLLNIIFYISIDI